MGKQPGPSPEELEFIFKCFMRGLQNSEVLEEMRDTEFPVRNPHFMRDRRREFSTARKVLEEHGVGTNTSANWVDDYEAKHRELPPVPYVLMPLIFGCSAEDRVSKSMKLRPTSAQLWNQILLPDQREQLLQFAEWLGENREDYLARSQRWWPTTSHVLRGIRPPARWPAPGS
ncbi:hypothetical protein ACFLVX_04205 [Chloroflexota bacterium]